MFFIWGALNDLCSSLAMTARRICTSYVDPNLLSPLLASRLIALDKCPGVRPIGIGDTARRIIAKAVLFITRPDIQEATGCFQMCGGQISGIEAAVHAVRSAFELETTEGVLLVDASNAFNNLNREVALLNIGRICPPLATIVVNTYRAPSELFVDGEVLYSEEGTTQGDPLAMPLYALATIPLIKKIEGDATQVWYADDAAAAGKIEDLRHWWDKLSSEGPSFGYFVNATKTWLVAKDHCLEKATSAFADTDVQVTSTGRPYLGSAIGCQSYVTSHVEAAVSDWVDIIKKLTNIALSQPHAAYSALTHGLTSKWTYLCRTTPNINDLMSPLDDALHSSLIPALTGGPPPNDLTRRMFALPARHGGLGIGIPSSQARDAYSASLLVTDALYRRIGKNGQEYDYDVISSQMQAKATLRAENKKKSETAAATLREELDTNMLKIMELAREKGSSTWLTALPLEEHGFTLHKRAFHDAIALRYGWSPQNMPSMCACGSKASIEHAMSCVKGGFPSIRHNEIRDLTATLLTEVCKDVCIEPELQPVTGEVLDGATANSQSGARLDIAANGFWGGSFERTYFDVRVFNPHAPSNKNTSLSACYKRHERCKKRAYEQRIREIEHGSFTPLVMSATGGLADEANTFYKRLASLLATKWDHPYSTTLCWLRCRLGFSLVRSAIQSIRGARSSCGHAIKCPTAVDLVNSEANIAG